MSQDSVTNLASILAGTVATIIGFYFGTRASEGNTSKSGDDAPSPPPPNEPANPPPP